MVNMFKSKNLQSVKHGFFGRLGGVSTGIYSSLNLSEKTTDSKANIDANRALVMDELDISSEKVFFPNQKHTSNVIFACFRDFAGTKSETVLPKYLPIMQIVA